MSRSFVKFVLLCGLIAAVVSCTGTRKAPAEKNARTLVWSDEFDYSGLPDSTKWGYDLGDGCPSLCGWGNNEWQYYTARRPENARVENGFLVIEARREKTGTREYSSARLVTKHKGDWRYGRIAVRAKLPAGLGVWPAIWMLSTDWKYGGWPESGEIDIMENVGYMPDSIFGSVHTKRFNHIQGTQTTKGVYDNTLSSAFHEYAIDWDAEKIDFLFDGQPYLQFRNRHEGPDAWPFDQDFHLILNIAVGGNWGGQKGVDSTIWPQKMLIDYVRIFKNP
ncbi:MAG: glycoside hydrolase family 16 protein [Saprospiraceae bacterium]|nr:glycoside hydrolase family 16 protein [Saprospiraceae bacterium]MCB0542762.1 glycoside hydrolase family 16 protein [Saprospiraceae bacterium]MCB0574622.1 glycoside hydrolase family 16 protein [Saprospiraceae bacterium]MCB9352988.1 glycoside hydrolase family 16 protein [Lewinellaceae bacterium]